LGWKHIQSSGQSATDRFKGVLDRLTDIVHIYQKPTTRGGKAEVVEVPLTDTTTLETLIDDEELYEKLMEDAELLEELLEPLDMERVMDASQSPLFFGSAMTNFGVQLFLDKFCEMGTMPLGRSAISSDAQQPNKNKDKKKQG